MESWLRILDDLDDIAALLVCAASPATVAVIGSCIGLLCAGALIAGVAGFAAAALGSGALAAGLPLLASRSD